MSQEFATNTFEIKKIARAQMQIDREFAKQAFDLERKLYNSKISGQKFWALYKKAMLKSVNKNKKSVETLLKKTDKEMKQMIKQAEKEKKKRKTKNH